MTRREFHICLRLFLNQILIEGNFFFILFMKMSRGKSSLWIFSRPEFYILIKIKYSSCLTLLSKMFVQNVLFLLKCFFNRFQDKYRYLLEPIEEAGWQYLRPQSVLQVSFGSQFQVPRCRISDDRKAVLQINADAKRTCLSWPSSVFCS